MRRRAKRGGGFGKCHSWSIIIMGILTTVCTEGGRRSRRYGWNGWYIAQSVTISDMQIFLGIDAKRLNWAELASFRVLN